MSFEKTRSPQHACPGVDRERHRNRSVRVVRIQHVGIAQGTPASKAAVAIKELIDLSQTAGGPPNSANDTGWVDVLETTIKTSSQKDPCSTWRCSAAS